MTEHTNLDLQLVQKYVRYMELYEKTVTGVLTGEEIGEEIELLHSMESYGDSIMLMGLLVRLTAHSLLEDENYPNPKELCMAISLWMLQRPSPEPEPPSGHIDRYTGHAIPDVKQTDAQFTEDDLEEFACRMAAEAEQEDGYDPIPYE